MYNPYQPYQFYNPQANAELLDKRIAQANKQLEDLNNMKKEYTQPVNNFINTQPANNNLIEWRILNENEEVDNLYVNNKTLFINDNMMVLKGVDGSLEKWEVKKIYPVDKKDERINQLEEEIKKLKEMIDDEHRKSNKSARTSEQSTSNDDGNVKSKSATDSK